MHCTKKIAKIFDRIVLAEGNTNRDQGTPETLKKSISIFFLLF
jgi:hypothetical protein